MGVQWTEEQKKVIDLRNRNILVSAAAGSGKTAVLVERILSLVTDKEHPVDVDRLLIMTFTRAAAGELKVRLAGALEARLEENPEDEHLQRQISLVHNAQITTIHGFCAYVIQNYFHMLDLDPGYRVADEGECRLLMGDVAKEVINAGYEEESAAYERFVESYSAGKTDEGLEGLILRLYDFAMSYPWPKECLRNWEEAYHIEDAAQLQNAPWMSLLWEQARKYLEEAREIADKNRELSLGPDGPAVYEKTMQADREWLESLLKITDYNEMYEALQSHTWKRLSPVKDPDVSEVLKERIQDERNHMKKLVEELGETFFPVPEEEVWKTMTDCRESIHVLTELTLQFMEAYGQKKREKSILDFSDMEHFALDILLKKEGDAVVRTQAAKELSLRYEEVMVDEYQDSNLVQEYLMNAVSGWAKEKNNTFMVGDVKQSIYRFRLARPELFMEKFKKYTLTDSGEQRIDLHRNFRSRAQVLESVNYMFRQIMGEELGGVAYDKDAYLYPGAAFPEKTTKEDENFADTEVIFVDTDGPDSFELSEKISDRELEALAIAGRIREIAGKEQVFDKKTGTYRPAGYGDIVILLRTMEGWADTFAKVLGGQGIPAYTASKTGYFSALEVVTVLNLLRICDNPRQEIPYGAILHSPMVGCTAQELALIRTHAPEAPIYEAVPLYAENGEDAILREKLEDFLELLEDLRRQVPYTPIHQFILNLFRKTGYKDYVSALPGGAQRQANLDMLVEKAMDYEKTSYRGLFHFVRYIDSLQSYKVDFGEVNLTDGTDTVEIMSIHKSKGLEFPIVFVAGMGKNFNTQELRSALVMHPELGIGADAVYPQYRAKIPTLLKQMIKIRTKDENLGEELRVLYVAFTRAKEKLILTGTIKNMEKKIHSLLGMQERFREKISYVALEGAKTYWDWILPAVCRHRSFAPIWEAFDLAENPGNPLYEMGPDMRIYRIGAKALVQEQMGRQITYLQARERLLHWETEPIQEEIQKEIQERFSFSYPYENRREIPVKVSVSELKHRKMDRESDSYVYYPEMETEPLIPKFIEDKEETFTGAARGTAYHLVMEFLDYGKIGTAEEIAEQIRTLEAKRNMKAGELSCVRPEEILSFSASSLGQRMRQAYEKENLFREQPFVISRPAEEIHPGWTSGENVLVQGIIDAWFLEEEEIVLVDYKTDKVRPGQEQRLIDRYQIQLYSYGEALTRLTGKKVKEIDIYSFTLGRPIKLPI